MNSPVKVSLIIGAAILLAVGLYIYFSPYHSCVRSYDGKYTAEVICARHVGGQ